MRGPLIALGAWFAVYGSVTMAGLIAHYGVSMPDGSVTYLYWGSIVVANIGAFLFISAFPRIKE